MNGYHGKFLNRFLTPPFYHWRRPKMINRIWCTLKKHQVVPKVMSIVLRSNKQNNQGKIDRSCKRLLDTNNRIIESNAEGDWITLKAKKIAETEIYLLVNYERAQTWWYWKPVKWRTNVTFRWKYAWIWTKKWNSRRRRKIDVWRTICFSAVTDKANSVSVRDWRLDFSVSSVRIRKLDFARFFQDDIL